MPAAAVVSTQDHFPGKTNDNGTRISRDAFAKKKKRVDTQSRVACLRETNTRKTKTKTSIRTKADEQWRKVQKTRQMLSRSDARHVVVLRQRREVLVQLFDALLVRFRAAFAFQSVVELRSIYVSFCTASAMERSR